MILWDDSSVGQEVRWDYTMVFSEDWRYITKGGVTLVKKNGTESEVKFGRDLYYHRYISTPSPFLDKKEHMYVSGSGPGSASYHFSLHGDSYISYENSPKTWKTDDGKKFP